VIPECENNYAAFQQEMQNAEMEFVQQRLSTSIKEDE
jgi:hypothetical protein